MPISLNQGEALTTLLAALRKDWNPAGIRAALKKASFLGSAAEVAVAACRCAADPAMRTPFLIAEPGPHWQGTTAGTRQAPTMCAAHPAQKAGACPACFKAARPKPANFTLPPRTRPRDWTPEPVVSDLAAVRERADEMEGL